MSAADVTDTLIRAAAFEHIRRLQSRHDQLDPQHLAAGFTFQEERIPLINPRRGIFKP